MEYADKTLPCVGFNSQPCPSGGSFTFTAGEQKFFAEACDRETGAPLTLTAPKRCVLCRKAKREYKMANGESAFKKPYAGSKGRSDDRGRDAFKPRGDRQIFDDGFGGENQTNEEEHQQ